MGYMLFSAPPSSRPPTHWSVTNAPLRYLWQVALIALLALSFLPVYAEDPAPLISLPDLGSPNRASFSQQQEDVLSLAFLEAVYQQADLITDPELNDYIRDIGAKLLRHVHSNRKFQFYIIKDDSINAFAGPGGIIAIHSGLILAAKREDELAAVMAHEIEHVQQEHLSRMFDNGKKGMIPTIAGLVGALLVGSQSPQAAMAMVMGGIGYSAQQQLAFSRDNEWEADRIGIDVLHAAGYDPNAMADFFDTLSNRYRNDSKAPEMLMSHPVTGKRISDSRARARTLTLKTKAKTEDLDLAQIRLKQLLGQTQTLSDAKQACYQQHIAYNLEKRTLTAPNCNELPQHKLSRLVLLQNQSAFNESAWQELIDLYPNNTAIRLRFAEALIDNNQTEKAIKQLTPFAHSVNERWALWETIARAWHSLGDDASEAYSMANAYASIGALKLAIIQIDRAEKQADSSHQPHLKQHIEALKSSLLTQEKQRKAL
jgi:predicted Zn-dependent protease